MATVFMLTTAALWLAGNGVTARSLSSPDLLYHESINIQHISMSRVRWPRMAHRSDVDDMDWKEKHELRFSAFGEPFVISYKPHGSDAHPALRDAVDEHGLLSVAVADTPNNRERTHIFNHQRLRAGTVTSHANSSATIILEEAHEYDSSDPRWQGAQDTRSSQQAPRMIEAIIRLWNGTKMYIEPAHRILAADAPSQALRDYVVYRDDHVRADLSRCGARVPPGLSEKQHDSQSPTQQQGHQDHNSGHQGHRYGIEQPASPHESTMSRRADGVCSSKCTCPVYLIADHTFFNQLNQDLDLVIARVVMMLDDVDNIYRNTPFPDLGYGLSISNVKVFTSASEPGNPVPGSSYNAESFLEAFSHKKYSGSCLVHMFTHREFADGLLGLAWVSSPSGAGICDSRGYNAGFSTSLNYDRSVSLGVQTITVAHEIGHNFGSQHDPDTSECAPGGAGGNYIMYASATDGSKPNNNRFSSCSREQMGQMIDRHSNKCFTNSKAVCGNGIVEAGEICDCGDSCSEDPCCNSNCTLPASAQCSPQDPIRFPCCTSTCTFVANQTKVCAAASTCAEATYCDGASAACPAIVPLPDNTLCECLENNCEEFPQSASKVCINGKCSGSICLIYNATQCTLYGEDACQLACQGPGWGDGKTCVSSGDRKNRHPNVTAPIDLAPGTPCENYKGYCAANGICKTVKSNDILDDIIDYFNNITEEDVLRWFQNNWMYLLAALAGVVLIIVGLKVTYRRKYVDEADISEREPLVAHRQGSALDHDAYFPALGEKDAVLVLSGARRGTFMFVKGKKRGEVLLCVSDEGAASHNGIQTLTLSTKIVNGQLRVPGRDDVFDSLAQVARQLATDNELVQQPLRNPVMFGELYGRRQLWRP